MPKFAANLSTMFPEFEVPDRFAAARDVGFTAVEFLRPYNFPLASVRQWLDDAGLEMLLLNSPPGDSEAGEKGMAALPGREGEFRESLDLALEYANGLGATMMHLMAGVVPDDVPAVACEEVFVENLRVAGEVAKDNGVALLLEPLNLQDAPGYLHTNTAHTRRIIDAVGGDTQVRSLEVLKPGGVLVSIVSEPDADQAVEHGVRARFLFVEPHGEQLTILAREIDRGRLRAHVGKMFPLAEAARAHEESQVGHVRGKLVLTL